MAVVREYTNKNIGIYKITNTNNGKVYIGQSINLPSRIASHFASLKNHTHHNGHLQNAYNLDPDAFIAEIICLCDEDDLDNLEQYYIKSYNSNTREFGYNIEAGGKWATSGPNKRPVICIETGLEYESGAAASRSLGLSPFAVGSGCGRATTVGGYHWVYKDDYYDNKEYYDRQAADSNNKRKGGLTGPRNAKVVNLSIGVAFRSLDQLAEPYKSRIYQLEDVLKNGGGMFDGMYWVYFKDYMKDTEKHLQKVPTTLMEEPFDLVFMGGVRHG